MNQKEMIDAIAACGSNWVNEDKNFNRATKACKLLVAKHRELRLAGCQSPARTAQRLLADALQLC